MRLIVLLLLCAALAIALFFAVDLSAVALWAAEQQLGFQTHMAGAIRALRADDPGALAALIGAAGAYGFVHAVGPGHGKYLIGGVGLGTSVPLFRLVGLSIASSLAQSLWAILLVYGGFSLFEASAQRMTSLAEEILAPASYLAIASVGMVLAWRGVSAFVRHPHRLAHAHSHAHDHDHGACGCHAHGPTPGELTELGSAREATALIASIAVRPCTGAIFLLVIAWQMEIRSAGAAAVIVMGSGTALLTSLTAVSSVAARSLTWVSSDRAGLAGVALPGLQAIAGLLIAWISFSLFAATFQV